MSARDLRRIKAARWRGLCRMGESMLLDKTMAEAVNGFTFADEKAVQSKDRTAESEG